MRPLAQKTRSPDYVIRPFEPKDRERIRWLCCETGFLGDPIDEVFLDRDLFADYLTRYYTDIEPDTCWVGEKDGVVVGYLLGCKRWKRNQWWSITNSFRMVCKATWRLLKGNYDAKTRSFLAWVLLKGWRETPEAPKESAHFHFNSLKEHRKMGIARDLLLTLFEDLKRYGIHRVYGQMITYDHRRSEKLYEYMGWKVTSKREVTKYKDQMAKKLYLSTLVMDF